MTPATTQRFICRDAQADPVDDLRQCEAAIRAANWWKRANLQEHWPLSTQQAAELLAKGGEFDADDDDLDDLVERHLLPSPATGDEGEAEWSAADVVEASGILEGRQQWRATPSAHDPKKHCTQLILEEARANGEVELIVNGGLARFDLRHLLCLLVASDVHEGRAKIVTLLKATLEVEYGVFV